MTEPGYDDEDAELDALMQQLESFDMPAPASSKKKRAYDKLVRPTEYAVPRVSQTAPAQDSERRTSATAAQTTTTTTSSRTSGGDYDMPKPGPVAAQRKAAPGNAGNYEVPAPADASDKHATYAEPQPAYEASGRQQTDTEPTEASPSAPASSKKKRAYDKLMRPGEYAVPRISQAAQGENARWRVVSGLQNTADTTAQGSSSSSHYAVPKPEPTAGQQKTAAGSNGEPSPISYEVPAPADANYDQPIYEEAQPGYEDPAYAVCERNPENDPIYDTPTEESLYEHIGALRHSAARINKEALPEGCCALCRKPIRSNAIQALELQFHEEHFQCMKCEKALCDEPFHALHGLPFCRTCFHEETAPRCAGCDLPITTACIRAFDKNWHEQCLKCDGCHNPLGKQYFTVEEQTLCFECFEKQSKYKCAKCNKTITDAAVSALDSFWHEDCFTCWVCDKPFPEGRFFPEDNKPYCSYHYHELKGVVCARCTRPIMGSFVSALGEKWHPEHFQCSLCNKSLAQANFRERNSQAYCDPCYVKLFGV